MSSNTSYERQEFDKHTLIFKTNGTFIMSLGACLSFMPYHVPYSIRHLAKYARAPPPL